MKIRNGFVSNSSSSSFMIHGASISNVASHMLDVIIESFEEGLTGKDLKDSKNSHKQWKNNLKIGLGKRDVKNDKLGITMPSCNYDTYLINKDGCLYIATCNNHDWDLASVNYDDRCEDKTIQDIIRDSYYYNIINKMIHSRERFNDDGDTGKCPKCSDYYGNYVIDRKGIKRCASCFKGKLGPTDAAKMETLRKKTFTNPITSLKLED